MAEFGKTGSHFGFRRLVLLCLVFFFLGARRNCRKLRGRRNEMWKEPQLQWKFSNLLYTEFPLKCQLPNCVEAINNSWRIH